MAKKAGRPRKAKEEQEAQREGAVDPKQVRRGRKERAIAKEQKPPANPFGTILPNADQQGSPADKNWKPTGDPVTDIATLESQEKFLYRMMMRQQRAKNLAKAEAQEKMGMAEETSVTDGFPVEDKIRLHKEADKAQLRAEKAQKEYKRARAGWQSVQDVIHRYLTDSDNLPLLDQKRKAG